MSRSKSVTTGLRVPEKSVNVLREGNTSFEDLQATNIPHRIQSQWALVTINVSSVPEPSTYALLGSGVGVLLLVDLADVDTRLDKDSVSGNPQLFSPVVDRLHLDANRFVHVKFVVLPDVETELVSIEC